MITDEMIEDILCAAFEGGINYWCAEVRVMQFPRGASYASEVPSRGGVIELRELEERTWRPMGREAIEKGIRKAAKLKGVSVEEFYENHDAGDADIAVQLAVLGKVVYS